MRSEYFLHLFELFFHFDYVGDLHPLPIFLEALVHQVVGVEPPILPDGDRNAPDPFLFGFELTPPGSLPRHHRDDCLRLRKVVLRVGRMDCVRVG